MRYLTANDTRAADGVGTTLTIVSAIVGPDTTVTWVIPADTPWTTPLWDTDATVPLSVFHETGALLGPCARAGHRHDQRMTRAHGDGDGR